MENENQSLCTTSGVRSFSLSLPQRPVERAYCFSTEKGDKKAHSDKFCVPEHKKTLKKPDFRGQSPFPRPHSTENPASGNNHPFCRLTKKGLSDKGISFFHSIHPLYGYYCWYSYVFSCIVSRCHTRGRGKLPPTGGCPQGRAYRTFGPSPESTSRQQRRTAPYINHTAGTYIVIIPDPSASRSSPLRTIRRLPKPLCIIILIE